MKYVIISTPMPWPLYQIAIRKALNFYKINNFINVSLGLHLPKISKKNIYLPPLVLIRSLILGINLNIAFLRYFLNLQFERSIQKRRNLLKKIATMKIYDCEFGDIILSGYIRSPFSNGTLKIGIHFLKSCVYILLMPIIFNYIKFILIKFIIDKGEDFEIILNIPEYVRVSQFIRRCIYKLGKNKFKISEIFFEKEKNKFIVEEFADCNSILIKDKVLESYDLSEKFIDKSWNDIQERLYGERHVFAHTENLNSKFDIDNKSDIDINMKNFLLQKKPVVLFPLHQTADEQFVWGFDDFGDIDTFNQSVINYCIKNNYLLIIKPHPMAFSNLNREKSKIESKYYSYLFRKYINSIKFDENNLRNNSFISRYYPNIILSSYSYPITKYLDINSNILTCTRHGRIVIESLATKTPTIFCTRSRYLNFNLKNTFDNYETLIFLLDKFNKGSLFYDLPDSNLLKYISACSIYWNLSSFNMRSLEVLKNYCLVEEIRRLEGYRWQEIFSELNISKYTTFESTKYIKESTNDFSKVLNFKI